MRTARLTFSVSALLLLPLTAAAEPIPLNTFGKPITVNYHADVLANTGASLVLPADGTITLDRQAVGNWRGSLPVFTPHDGLGAGAPANPVDGQEYGYSNEFRVRLTLSDSLSGQSGAVTVSGWESVEWIFRAGDEPWAGWRSEGTFFGLSLGTTGRPNDPMRLALNGVNYDFSTTFKGGDFASALTLDAAPSAPEPGTLLLAAGGLLSAAGVRRWRRADQPKT
jgi:hypothetical protein